MVARRGAVLSMLLAVGLTSHALADTTGQEVGCTSTQPVLISGLLPDHSWPLPLSAEHSSVITEARIAIELLPPSPEHKLWTARIHATFPDPLPYGLPYSYQKVAFAWNAPEASGNAVLDWTEGCRNPGRSLFPGQKWTQDWEIPGTEGLSRLDDPSFALWGSRN